MRVLLDTNVLIAAFITHGTCSDLFEHCIRQHKIITSKFILGELEGHLRKKFKFPEADVQEAMGMLNSASEIVEPAPLKESVCRDPDDDMVLATALSGNVDCLVSGDKDLTEMKAFENIPILKPSEFSAFEASRK
jgi:putative PIN family toxin of toxin-antitoxin system